MQEPDFSNPLTVITAFFSIFFTGLAFIIKIVPVAFASAGLAGAILGLIGAIGVLFKIFTGD